MNKELRNNILKDLGKSRVGEALRDYLKEAVETMKDELTKTNNWEETLGIQKAIGIIKKKFKFLEKEEQEKKQRTSYQ